MAQREIEKQIVGTNKMKRKCLCPWHQSMVTATIQWQCQYHEL